MGGRPSFILPVRVQVQLFYRQTIYSREHSGVDGLKDAVGRLGIQPHRWVRVQRGDWG